MAKYSFTVITPCYNGAQYITTCIEAIAKANYDHDLIEHIVVDDGSTDNTKQICEQLAKKYPHVKFYSKPNANWGSVFNYVKNNKLAHGDYIFICDADDYLLENAFATVNAKCKNADIFCGSFYRKYIKHKLLVHPYFRLFTREFKNAYSRRKYSPVIVPQSCFFKKQIFYSLPDLKERVSYQDTVLYSHVLSRADRIRFTKELVSVYWYKRPGNSMSTQISEKGLQTWVANLEEFSQNDWLDAFTAILLGNKQLRKYVKAHNLKFSFKDKRLHKAFLPFFVRPFYTLVYLLQVKKFVK